MNGYFSAQLLAQVAMQSQQPDTMSSIQQAVQLASIGTTAVSASSKSLTTKTQ